MIRVGAVGDNCVDMYDNIGELYVGGNPVNVAVYIKRLGGESIYAGVVGSDGYGKWVKEELNKKGVDVSMVKTIEGTTAISHIDLIEKERVFGEYEEGVLLFSLYNRFNKSIFCRNSPYSFKRIRLEHVS